MERQDLTQGQLGSFKFTPVDSVSSYEERSYFPWNYREKSVEEWASQDTSSKLFDHTNFNLRRPPWLHPADTWSRFTSPSSVSHHCSSASPPRTSTPVSDPSFFNKHIRPDLGDSRLKLGSAALRSAVNGNSPEKTTTQDCRSPQVSAKPSNHSSTVTLIVDHLACSCFLLRLLSCVNLTTNNQTP